MADESKVISLRKVSHQGKTSGHKIKYSWLLLWRMFALSGCLFFKPYCYSCRQVAGNHAEAAQEEILKDLHLISRFNQMWMLWSPTRSESPVSVAESSSGRMCRLVTVQTPSPLLALICLRTCPSQRRSLFVVLQAAAVTSLVSDGSLSVLLRSAGLNVCRTMSHCGQTCEVGALRGRRRWDDSSQAVYQRNSFLDLTIPAHLQKRKEKKPRSVFLIWGSENPLLILFSFFSLIDLHNAYQPLCGEILF